MTFGPKDITFCGPKVADGCPEAQEQNTKTLGTKDTASFVPKVTKSCTEAQVRRPGPSGQVINLENEGGG